MNSFDLWDITRIPGNKIARSPDNIEMMDSETNGKIPKSGKTKRKRSCKRKNKELKTMLDTHDAKEEEIFNEGDGLIGKLHHILENYSCLNF